MISQSTFIKALRDPNIAPPKGLLNAQGQQTSKRFNVYRNNVAGSLGDAMHAGFEGVFKLLGEENFKNIVSVYIKQYPPTSPIMMLYGDAFPAFLQNMQGLEHLPFLPDVAQFELMQRSSYHSADTPSLSAQELSPNQLGDIEEAQLPHVIFNFAPATRLVKSNWPILSIYRLAMGETDLQPTNPAEDVLITRINFDPQPHILPIGGAQFVEALMAGKSLGEASELASEELDLGACLSSLLTSQAIYSISLNEQTS